jgi:hypothetical protein
MPPLTDTFDAASTAPPSARPRMRASDANRLAVISVLQDAVARGLLTLDEGSDRMAAAFAAVHVDDLRPLTADLPPVRAAAPVAPGWRQLGTIAAEQFRVSLTDAGTGKLHPARVAFVFLIALLLLAAFGSMVGDLLFDGGGRGRGGFDNR